METFQACNRRAERKQRNQMLKDMKKAGLFVAMFAALLAGVVLVGCRGNLGWDDRMSSSWDRQSQSHQTYSD